MRFGLLYVCVWLKRLTTPSNGTIESVALKQSCLLSAQSGIPNDEKYEKITIQIEMIFFLLSIFKKVRNGFLSEQIIFFYRYDLIKIDDLIDLNFAYVSKNWYIIYGQ